MRIVKLSVLFLILNTACSSQEHQREMGEKHKFTNQLINETSPYLLQHAHNPVDWHPWNEKTLEKAQKEEKLLIISIGYSACHWCHVMEHETFEDESVAKIMNENFICIKVELCSEVITFVLKIICKRYLPNKVLQHHIWCVLNSWMHWLVHLVVRVKMLTRVKLILRLF